MPSPSCLHFVPQTKGDPPGLDPTTVSLQAYLCVESMCIYKSNVSVYDRYCVQTPFSLLSFLSLYSVFEAGKLKSCTGSWFMED